MSTRPFRHFVGAFVLGWVLLGTMPHGIAASDPGAFVDGLAARALKALAPRVPPSHRIAAFRHLFREDFDVPGIARFTLGRYWRTATPGQRQEFMRLFTDFTAQAYSDRLAQYNGARFRVTGSRQDDNHIVVGSEMAPPGAPPVRADWYLKQADGGYKITDVAIDGVSMRLAERDRFAWWIQHNDGRVDALLAVLRQQLVSAR